MICSPSATNGDRELSPLYKNVHLPVLLRPREDVEGLDVSEISFQTISSVPAVLHRFGLALRPRLEILRYNSVEDGMCQLCNVKAIALRDRWPKPLEHHKADIELLITSAHDEYIAFHDLKLSDKNQRPPESLLELLRLLATVLEDLEDDRQKWWSLPEKRERRKRLEEECDQTKLTELYKINNGTVERIEAMSAKLRQFVKWSLDMVRI